MSGSDSRRTSSGRTLHSAAAVSVPHTNTDTQISLNRSGAPGVSNWLKNGRNVVNAWEGKRPWSCIGNNLPEPGMASRIRTIMWLFVGDLLVVVWGIEAPVIGPLLQLLLSASGWWDKPRRKPAWKFFTVGSNPINVESEWKSEVNILYMHTLWWVRIWKGKSIQNTHNKV